MHRAHGRHHHPAATSPPWLDAFVDPDAAAPVGAPPLDELRARLGDRAPDIDLTDLATPILESLEAWRESAARAARVAPEAVLSDRVLRRIAECRPETIAELADVPGVGSAKARRFGPRLLEISAPAGICD